LKEGTTARKPPGKPPVFDKDIAFNLYSEGKTDKEIAELLGIKEKAVYNWRERNKLPVKSVQEYMCSIGAEILREFPGAEFSISVSARKVTVSITTPER
jgi:uncharacterized protein YjcR